MEEKYTVRSVLNDPAEETEPKKGRPGAAGSPLEQAKNWAMSYLRRPRSEKELRDRLAQKGCAPEDMETVVTLCLDYGFINDREYAGMIVRHYTAGGYGPGRIRMELKRRGVPPELWDEALEELPADTDAIDRLLAARLRGKDPGDRKERDKAASALFRKGYSWEDIRAAMERYRNHDED